MSYSLNSFLLFSIFMLVFVLLMFLPSQPSPHLIATLGIRLMPPNHVLIASNSRKQVYNMPRSQLSSNTVVLTPGYPIVLDQGPWGSCTAFAMRYAFLYWMERKSLSPVEPSTSYWYARSRMILSSGDLKDTGSTTTATVSAITLKGTPSLLNYPYTAFSIFNKPSEALATTKYNSLSFTRIPSYLKTAFMPAWRVQGEAFVEQIDMGRAVLVSFYVYASMMTQPVFVSGVIPAPTGKLLGGHAICLTGYTRGDTPAKNTFSFFNSWGSYLGDSGKFTIPWSYIGDSTKTGDYWYLS